VADLNREAGLVLVTGKGRRTRICPYGAKTGQALDRYLRMREKRPDAAKPWMWLTRQHHGDAHLTDAGLRAIMHRRCTLAGIPYLHPHQLRHTFAHEFLSAGGNEGDLMMLAGWRSRAMLDRYGRSAAAERARDAYRRMGFGDRL
jgi:site-specific recombinase XerD